MNERPEWLDYEDTEEIEAHYWTPRRVIITIIILVTLIAFLVYTIAPALLPPAPPPPITLPRQQA